MIGNDSFNKQSFRRWRSKSPRHPPEQGSNPVPWSSDGHAYSQYLGPYGVKESICRGHSTRVLVGGPGFEPGTSRSRNLSGSSMEVVFEGFEFIPTTHWPSSSHFQPPNSPGLLHELLHRIQLDETLRSTDRCGRFELATNVKGILM
jgi:hypothetical protein